MKRVLIIEAQIKRYRLPFYEKLVRNLRSAGLELQVGYSDPSPSEAVKRDSCDLPAEYGIKVKGHWRLREKLVFQPLSLAAMKADLVIVDQGNKYLLNHFLLPLSRAGLHRVAFWGLAENRQQNRIGLSEWYRKKTLNWVSWWFAYTKGTAQYLVDNGVPDWKITAVDNAVDTNEIRNHVNHVSAEQRASLRASLGIPMDAPVGIFCGMLDKVKGVQLLVDSAKAIRARLPQFHLLVLGTGPDHAAVEQTVKGLSWIHFTGPRFGKEKSEFIAISDAFLMPGRVGLVILDSFAGGLPLLTTRLNYHGPEFEYLEEGVNGLVSEADPSAFADMVVSLFLNRFDLLRLQAGARDSGARYTIENMVAKFGGGIQNCLGLSPAENPAEYVNAES